MTALLRTVAARIVCALARFGDRTVMRASDLGGGE